MPSRRLFATRPGTKVAPANAVNEAGGVAYQYSDKHALAQYAVTGTLPEGGTFYTTGENELDTILQLAAKCDPAYVAKAAVYARSVGMKDSPALLLAYMTIIGNTAAGKNYFKAIFNRVVDNSKMLQGFVQIVRSGVVGRKSLGTRIKTEVRQWLYKREPEKLFNDAVGGTGKGGVSLPDIIKMVHIKPRNAAERALFGWLVGRCGKTAQATKELNPNAPEGVKLPDYKELPKVIKDYEKFKADLKAGKDVKPPKGIRWEFLTALPLKPEHWVALAERAGWRQLIKNLNTFARHNVFKNQEAVQIVADKLRDKVAIQEKVKPFPYEILAAYNFVDAEVPAAIKDALHDAMDLATVNVPTVPGKLVVCPDVSGSMDSPVTGYRGSATSKMKCRDVAGLLAAIALKRNPVNTTVLPFASDVFRPRLEPRDSILTLANKIAHSGNGGTNMAAPLAWLNQNNEMPDYIVFLSDNESWIETAVGLAAFSTGTYVAQELSQLRARNNKLRVVGLNLAANSTTQAAEADCVLNIGGWSNEVWSLITDFLTNGKKPGNRLVGEDVETWVKAIDAVEL